MVSITSYGLLENKGYILAVFISPGSSTERQAERTGALGYLLADPEQAP